MDTCAGGAEGEQNAEAVLPAGAAKDHQERTGTGGEKTPDDVVLMCTSMTTLLVYQHSSTLER